MLLLQHMKRQKHIFVWVICGLVLTAYSAPSIVNGKLSNCKWHDLSGRQIRHSSFDTRRLPHGTYIRDGKKVLVK